MPHRTAPSAGEAPPTPGASAREPLVATSHGPRDSAVRRGLAVADVVALTGALVLAVALTPGREDRLASVLRGLPFLVVALGLFAAYGLYAGDAKRVAHSAFDEVPALFHALLVFSLLQWAWYRLLPGEQLVLQDVVIFGAAAFAGVLLLRAAARRLVARRLGRERVLIVGDDPTAHLLLRKMREHPEYDLEPVGVFGTDEAIGDPSGPRLGSLRSAALAEVVHRYRVERVVLSHCRMSDRALLDLVLECRRLQVKLGILPRTTETLGPSTRIDDVEGLTLLSIAPPVLSRSTRAAKRAMDLVLGSLGLLLAVPVLAVVAPAIKLDSPGPVFYRQYRVGRGGRRFRLIKFRTMSVDADARREELLAASKDPGWLLLDRDPRITRVGAILRRSSLDELPQLWNVLRGEMSLVGPRPLIEAEDARVSGWERGRLDLTPGITGLWQVLGRTNIPFDEMLKLDLIYVTNWSLWGDCKLILRTVSAVLGRRGVN